MTEITLIGNLTADPDLRFTSTGKPVANITVAVSKRTRLPDGSWENGDSSFYRCTAWGKLAEHVAESLTRGTRVIAVGRLEIREYETQQGYRRVSAEVTLDDIGPSLMFGPAVRNPNSQTGQPAAAWPPPSQPTQQPHDPWGQTGNTNDAPPPF